jgi:hypothetical protein
MKLLRPEIAELGEKFKKDPMKSNKKQWNYTTKQELIRGLSAWFKCLLMASFQFSIRIWVET